MTGRVIERVRSRPKCHHRASRIKILPQILYLILRQPPPAQEEDRQIGLFQRLHAGNVLLAVLIRDRFEYRHIHPVILLQLRGDQRHG